MKHATMVKAKKHIATNKKNYHVKEMQKKKIHSIIEKIHYKLRLRAKLVFKIYIYIYII